ncbi:MAG: alanine racemase [Candidatus Wallbacteria bacterium]|nr:alanine racemase [Candidatus Wallbacteria bacterium]
MHAWVEVDLDAVRANVRAIRTALRSGTDFIAMVKGNAYGHGAVEIASAVLQAGATHLGVAFSSEGGELRRAGITAPILVLGSFAEEDIPEILAFGMTPSVAELGLAAALAQASRARGQRTSVHIEVDTGMGRLGIDWRGAARLIEEISQLSGLCVEGIYTHFSTADEADRTYTGLQVRRFQQVSEALRQRGIFIPFRHFSNSAGVLHYPELTLDAIRPGLALYGLYPARRPDQKIQLRPALGFRSRVVLVKRMAAGGFVSYGRSYQLPEPRFVATVSVGYADGYPRCLGNKAQVLIRGTRYPVIGRVTMDHIMADVGRDDPRIARGERVTLIGRDGSEEISAEELAEQADTINYEITTRISNRAPRVYKGQMTSDRETASQ